MSDAKKEEEGKEGEGQAAAKPKSKKKLLIIIIAVAALMIVGGGVALLSGGKKQAAGEAEKNEDPQKHYALAELAPIIVNLSDTSSYLKVTLQIEYDEEVIAKAEAAEGGGKGGGHGGGASGGESNEKVGGLPGPFAKREPMIKDAIIRVLSAKKVEELLTPDGKEKLKEELIEAINEASALEEGAVVNIYFTEFIIQ